MSEFQKPITDNENNNFEMLSEEISEIPELEVLNSADRKLFEVFLDFWNVAVYSKFVMLAEQGGKNGAGKCLDLVRRVKSIIKNYNEKIKCFLNYSSINTINLSTQELQSFNRQYEYFEKISEKQLKLTKNELDNFERATNELYAIIAKKDGPPHAEKPETNVNYKNVSPRPAITQANKPEPGGPGDLESDETQPNLGQNKSEFKRRNDSAINYSIPFGFFCFFLGAGVAGPFGAVLGLGAGLLVASFMENNSQSNDSRTKTIDENIFNQLKNSEPPISSEGGYDRQKPDFSTARPNEGYSSMARPAAASNSKSDIHGLGCFTSFAGFILGAIIGGGAGAAGGLLIGFFISSLITGIINKKYENIKSSFTFNGFLIGAVIGILIDHVILGIIFGLIVSQIAYNAFIPAPGNNKKLNE